MSVVWMLESRYNICNSNNSNQKTILPQVTGGRLYRKVAIPCRPQKTFSLLVHEVPADLPEEDIRASLYRYCSVVSNILTHEDFTNN